MKKALCLIGGLAALAAASAAAEGPSYLLQFVDRDVCEKPENNYVQLFPYVSISSYDHQTGNVGYIRYRRPLGQGEERLHDRISVGFGGHIDSEADLPEDVAALGDVNANGLVQYRVTGEQLVRVLLQAARREMIEETGLSGEDVDAMNLKFAKFVRESDEMLDDVGRVRLCAYIVAQLAPSKFMKTMSQIQAAAEQTEIRDVDILTINLGEMLMDFNVQGGMQAVSTTLSSDKYKAENWTIAAICSDIQYQADFLRDKLSLTDLYHAILLKDSARQAAEAELAAQAAQSAANDNVSMDAAVNELADKAIQALDCAPVETEEPAEFVPQETDDPYQPDVDTSASPAADTPTDPAV